MDVKDAIRLGKTALGLELGSTRIKAVLIDETHAPIAAGTSSWENRLENGYWTYHIDEVWSGVQNAYADLCADVEKQYGEKLETVGAIGISAMMHGYLPFSANGELLSPFRTWRNTTTARAAQELTELLQFNIPQRWSVAHLCQAVLDKEPYVGDIAFLSTLACYVHWQLTGIKVAGVGEASGMFPIDSLACDYDGGMIAKADAWLHAHEIPYGLRDVLPRVLAAGEDAGSLTEAGAKLLDPSGKLRAGIPLCPPEGDAGTGMAATNSVSPRTGNVSAGTSVFLMAVLEKPLAKVHEEIDMVTTPSGAPVAMVHVNTCTSDLNAWVSLLAEAMRLAGAKPTMDDVYTMLFQQALLGDKDGGGLASFNCFAGEPVIGLKEGCPMLVRRPGAKMSLATFMRVQIYAALSTLKAGTDILTDEEHVTLEKLYGHGGLFKTPEVGQRLLAGALKTPVAVMETAGEGGPWGMALLAAYRLNRTQGETLGDYLANKVFHTAKSVCLSPDAADSEGFDAYLRTYKALLPAQRAAADVMKG